jgi:hypothetical protein
MYRLLIRHSSNDPRVVRITPFGSVYMVEVTNPLPSSPANRNRMLHLVNSNVLVIAGSSQPSVHIIDLDDNTLIEDHDISGGGSIGHGLAAPLDESFVLVSRGWGADRIELLDPSDSWSKTTLSDGIDAGIRSLAISPDKELVAVGLASSPYFRVYDYPAWTTEFTSAEFSSAGDIGDCAFTPDGEYLVCAAASKLVVYDVSDWSTELDLTLAAQPTGLAVTSTHAIVVTRTVSGAVVRIFQTSDWSEVTPSDAAFSEGGCSGVSVTPDEKYAVVTYAGSGVTIRVFDLDSLTLRSISTQDIDNQVILRAYAIYYPVELEAGGSVTLKLDVESSQASTPYGLDAEATIEQEETHTTLVGFTMPPSTMGMTTEERITRATDFITRMGMSDVVSAGLKGSIDFTQAFQLLDAAKLLQAIDLVSTLGMDDVKTISHRKVLFAAAALGMDSVFESSGAFAVNLAAAMALASQSVYGADLEVVDEMEFVTEFKTHYRALMSLQAAMEQAEEEDFSLRPQLFFLSEMSKSSVAETQATLQLQFQAILGSYATLRIGEDVFEGWVLQIGEQRQGGKPMAFTQYGNYPFTSIACFNGKYYGVADDGLYLLEGADDEGEAIQAAIKTGLLDFGQRFVKDAKALYLGYTSTGEIVLKVTTAGEGRRREDWYRVIRKEEAGMATGRATIQRGLRSTYWQFELCNVSGADFEIDDVTLVYQLMGRRRR